MADKVSKVVADMASAANPPVRDWKAEQAKQAQERLEAEKASYRLQARAQEEVLREEFWAPGRPGRWTDAEYQDICRQMPPRPGVK